MARLRRSSRHDPGWTRRHAGRGFAYLDSEGERLGPPQAQQVKDLVIPPAWRDVWICPHPNGHLQAVGTDDAGRLQYLYHPAWREARDGLKFVRTLEFGKALSRARERVLADLGSPGMSRERGCATAVRLLDLGYFRIGNDVYADTNGSFGLTTLERRHARLRGDLLVFTFTGKSGVDHRIEIDDEATIEALDVMRRRRGSATGLLAFKDGRSWRDIDSSTVNDYIRETTGMEATAKDFRTWHATVLAAVALGQTTESADTERARKRAISAAMKEVSEFLGNTPALARSSYVDPRVIDAFEEGHTIRSATRRSFDGDDERQAAIERAVLKLLRES